MTAVAATAGAVAPLGIGPWHIHGGWWTVGAITAFCALTGVVLGLCWDFEQRRHQIHALEAQVAELQAALSVPADFDHEAASGALADADTAEIPAVRPSTAPIPAQPPPTPGPATTPAGAAIDAGHQQLVETYSKAMGPDRMTFNFRKQERP